MCGVNSKQEAPGGAPGCATGRNNLRSLERLIITQVYLHRSVLYIVAADDKLFLLRVAVFVEAAGFNISSVAFVTFMRSLQA